MKPIAADEMFPEGIDVEDVILLIIYLFFHDSN